MDWRIVSGGQTGVDRAALDFALDAGMPCGGWCPPGRMAEGGTISAIYPVQEMATGSYRERTWQNVIDSDGTLILYHGILSGGTAETATAARARGKPLLLIDAAVSTPRHAAASLAAFIEAQTIHCLNIAGPRASEWPGGYDFTCAVLSAIKESIAGNPNEQEER